MISFFRLNSFDRLVILILIFVGIRALVWFYPPPLTVQELWWLLVGEALSKGDLLYKDVWDDLAPLPASIYALIIFVFGKNILIFRILASVLLLFQAFYFNQIVHRFQLYLERNYVPALCFVMFSFSFGEGISLSPVMIGNTFLLALFSGVLKEIKEGSRNNEVYQNGLFLGIAVLCYPPFALFFFAVAFAMLFYSGSKPGQYFLLMVGMFFPVISVGFFYFWYNEVGNFLRCFLSPFYQLFEFQLIDYKAQLFFNLFSAAFSFFSIWKITRNSRYVHFQTLSQVIVFFFLICGLLFQLFGTTRSAQSLLIFTLPCSFFAAHLFQLYKKSWQKELSFLLFSGLWIGVCLLINQQIISETTFGYKNLFVQKDNSFKIENKKILVIGDEFHFYTKNSLATPYLKAFLANKDLKYLNTYSGMASVYDKVFSDLPDYIIDKKATFKNITSTIPEIGKHYKKVGGNLFMRIN